MTADAVLADVILVIHFLFVAFVVGGLAAILAGAPLGWRWVRDRRFRLLHVGAIVFVALESLAGVACPLTVWENALRGGQSGRSFVGRWVAWLLYYDFPEWVFTALYVGFAVAVLAAWRWLPPRRHEAPSSTQARLSSG